MLVNSGQDPLRVKTRMDGEDFPQRQVDRRGGPLGVQSTGTAHGTRAQQAGDSPNPTEGNLE